VTDNSPFVSGNVWNELCVWMRRYNWTSSPISGTTWTHTYAEAGTYLVNVTCYNNVSVQSVVVPQLIEEPIVNLRLRRKCAFVVSIILFILRPQAA